VLAGVLTEPLLKSERSGHLLHSAAVGILWTAALC
jgi:hypothetical protein